MNEKYTYTIYSAPDNSQNFNRYSYCLNNPLKYTDPSGEFISGIVLGAIIGAVVGTYTGGSIANGSYNPAKWDYESGRTWGLMFGGSVIGAASGVAGAWAGEVMSGNFAASSFGAGAASGAVGGAVGGTISGAGNAWLDGASFGKGAWSGFVYGNIGAFVGGVVGGVSGGINARNHGGNFWNGEGATYDLVASTPSLSNKIEVGEGMEYSNKYAQKFSDDNFGANVEGVKELHADGTIPSGYSKNGDLVYSNKGLEVLGICEPPRSGNTIYLGKAAFTSEIRLYLTMGHEYLHACYNLHGLLNYTKQHDAIYQWEAAQAKIFNFNTAEYKIILASHPLSNKSYSKWTFPIINFIYK